GRSVDIWIIAQKVASVTWTLDTIFTRMPDGGTTQMGTDRYERIDPLLVTHHPDPLFLQHARADLAHLIIFWPPGNKLLQGFIQDAREKKAQRGHRDATPESSKAAPPHKTQQAPPRDTLFSCRGPYRSGHEASSPSFYNLTRSANN